LIEYWRETIDVDILNDLFRFFENLLKFIIDTKDIDKSLYKNIIASILSENEIIVYYYLGFLPEKKMLKAKFERLFFFMDIDDRLLLNKEHFHLYNHLKDRK